MVNNFHKKLTNIKKILKMNSCNKNNKLIIIKI